MANHNFYEEVATKVQEMLSERGYEVAARVVTVEKNNTVRTGIQLMSGGSFTAPVIYANPEDSVSDAAKKIVDMAPEHLNVNIDISKIKDWEWVKDHIYPVLIGVEKNAELIKKALYRPFLDMVVMYRIVFETPKGSGSTLVTPHMLGMWGLALEDVDRAAMSYLEKHSTIHTMMDVLSSYGIDGIPDAPMLIVSNDSKCHGASAMLYNRLLDAACDKWGSDVYILPSSIHEALVIPATDADPAYLREMVQSINETEVAPEEVLTNSVYYYSKGTELTIA